MQDSHRRDRQLVLLACLRAQVRVRVYDEELGIGSTVDELSDGGNAVWIFFSGTAPRRLPTDSGSTEFTVLESEARFP